jgi:hypothetical protein
VPFPLWNLNCNKACQALLLTRTVESWEFASDCDHRRWNRILNRTRSGAAQVGLHCVNIVVMSPSGTTLGFGIVCRRCCSTSVSRMLLLLLLLLLLTESKTLNPLSLTASTVTMRYYSVISLVSFLLFWSELLRSFSARLVIPRCRSILRTSMGYRVVVSHGSDYAA